MKTIAIFGATSAIAEQVARLYAARGDRFFLAGRGGVALARIAGDLKVRGAEAAIVHVVDFADTSGFVAMVDHCQSELGAPDVALLAYGILGDQQAEQADPSLARASLGINFVSPACLLDLLATRMAPGGTIGAITSVAGDRGRQSNYIYGAAKGGLSRFLQGLRHRLAPAGIRVVDIRPGFVDTPMTAHVQGKGPLWAQPEKVAKDIVGALDRGRAVLYTPWFWSHVMRIVRNVPAPIFHKTRL
jgi:NAD(P)-dependent dehydrogenase (short-subunit alcohol dehydrogenase family)